MIERNISEAEKILDYDSYEDIFVNFFLFMRFIINIKNILLMKNIVKIII